MVYSKHYDKIKYFFFLLSILFLSNCSNKIDLIVHNAVVYTVDDYGNKQSAFAINDGKFIAVGGDEIMEDYSAKSIVDAKGLPIYPGFIDSHCHYLSLGIKQGEIDLVGTNSFDEIIVKIKEYSEKQEKEFIIGRGWDQNDWSNKSLPINRLLNQAFPDKPVILSRIDGHAYLVNDYTLNLAGITNLSKIDGGEFIKSNGRLTGVLIDNSMQLIDNIIPEPTKEESINALLSAQDMAFENGLTTVSEAGISRKQIELIDSLQKSGILKIKIYAMIENGPDVDYYLDQGPYKTERLNVRSVKVLADGALGSRGASMIDEYSDRKGYYGLMITPADSIKSLAFKLAGTGFQLNTHAIGDNANRVVLNAYRDALFNYRDPRWRVEHAQVLSEGDIGLFNQKIIPSVQPTHATSDMYWLYDRIGKERAKYAYAFQDLLEKSSIIAFGTDFPVEDINPMMTFYSATVRKDKDGYPEDGFQTENIMNRLDALKAMTIFGAYANFEEDEKGSIEVGKDADFIILDNDIIRSSEASIPNTNVVATFINGELVFNRRYN